MEYKSMARLFLPLILLTGTVIAHPLLAQDAELIEGKFDLRELAVVPAALLALILYFVPTFIAHIRDVRAYAKIFFVNMLLGWTVIGWFAVLIWSLRAKRFFGRRKQSRSPSVQPNQRGRERNQLNERHISTLNNEAPNAEAPASSLRLKIASGNSVFAIVLVISAVCILVALFTAYIQVQPVVPIEY